VVERAGEATARQSILAMDDEPDILRLLERIITEKTDYRIKTTSNSLELPGLLETEEFDAIVTDLKMPGMDGLDVLRLVKERKRPEEVIIITAFGSLDTAVEALSLGVFDYITKPFKKEQLVFAVERVMRWQRLKRAEARMAAVFDTEPVDAAIEAFRREYASRRARRGGTDRPSGEERQ